MRTSSKKTIFSLPPLPDPDEFIGSLRRDNPARSFFFLFDFDGTLADIKEDPLAVTVPTELVQSLKILNSFQDIEILILSGRPLEFLRHQIDCRIWLTGEHGAESNFYQSIPSKKENIKSDLLIRSLEEICNKYPGSFLEEKPHSWVWHYRPIAEKINAGDVDRVKLRLSKVMENSAFEVNSINFGLELKNQSFRKDKYVQDLKSSFPEHLFIAFGDDQAEEEIFACLEPQDQKIAVGRPLKGAQFFVNSPEILRQWVRGLVIEREAQVG